MTLVCGVVETTHNDVEHPLVIAERLERAVPGTNNGNFPCTGSTSGDSKYDSKICAPSRTRCSGQR